MKDSTTTEDLVKEKEELMVFPSENSKKNHLLKPCLTTIDGSEGVLTRQNRRPNLKSLSFGVSFLGWRRVNTNFKSWATKMAALHKPTWQKAGIFEAVMASTYRIVRNTDLVLGIAEKWCPDTNTFVFPWGETTITLEDVMVLLGFSVLGLPVFATLDSSGKKIKAKLEKEWRKIKNDINFVTQLVWMKRFMDSNDELEHVAFLVCWLSYFVFPLRYYHLYEAVFPIAVHLSSGTKIALAPPVLAHLYAELSLLKNHIEDFGESTVTVKTDLTALFKLVQVWTWERFRKLQPNPNPLLKGEPRLALWDEKQRNSNVRRILDNSKIDSFEWRPYTKTVKKWDFPRFYPEKTMLVPVGPNLDDEFISFARCIKVSELVGIDYVEHYFPDRVASQFGMLQDVPCLVNRNNLSLEEAWDHYNMPIDDLTLYIPSRYAIPCVTPMFCEWWKKTFQEFQYSSKEKRFVDDTSLVPSGSKMNRTSEDGRKISKDSRKKRRKHMVLACYKRRKYMKQPRENDESIIARCQTQVPSDNNKEDDSPTIAQLVSHNKKKYSDVKNSEGDASEPLGKKSRLQADNKDSGPCQKLASIRADGDEAVPPPEIEQRNEETGSKAGKRMVLSPIDETNSLDPPLGANGVDIVMSPPETRQTCDDELGVNGSNKADMIDDGSKEPKCLLQEDGAIAEEKASSDEKLCGEAEKEDDDSLIQKKLAIEELALKAENNEPTPRKKLASGGTNGDETSKAYKSMVLSPSDESNIRIAAGDETQGQDCLLHDDGLGSEETMKSNEQFENLEKRNDDFGEDDVGNDSYEKSLHEREVMLSSIEERINKAERNVAWLKERRAIKQRKIAAARLI